MANRNPSKRAQVLFRLHKDKIEQLKAKIARDQISFQRMMELLIRSYLDDGKEIMAAIDRYKGDKQVKRSRYGFSEIEADAILRRIAKDSPITEAENIMNELEEQT